MISPFGIFAALVLRLLYLAITDLIRGGQQAGAAVLEGTTACF
jgi:hypothetical protein